jgi:hypothetical protein
MPVVSHEIGQWCVYPNFKEIEKYTGAMKARNFEIFQDFLTNAGLADQAEDFLMASGKLQVLCYKEEIETALRTPGFGGFQLLSLQDFPGQGTALVGVLDVFYEAKPYLTAESFRRFCGPITPLVRLPQRVWTPDEDLVAEIEVAHYGPKNIPQAHVSWTLTIEDQTVAEGQVQSNLLRGELNRVGRISVPLQNVPNPAKMQLCVRVEEANVENDWDLWVFPPTGRQAVDSRVIYDLNEAALTRLSQGETLWLKAAPGRVDTELALGFSPIFWNTAWTSNQPPHTLGILCDPEHPALRAFPTEMHSNWQWWHLISQTATMELPGHIRPIIQVVPDWFNPQCLGLAFDARIGKGRLLVTSIDFEAAGPVGAQLARSLSAHLDQADFPAQEMSVKQIQSLFREDA